MSFHLENPPARYARALVDLKTRMWEFTQTRTGRDHLHAFHRRPARSSHRRPPRPAAAVATRR